MIEPAHIEIIGDELAIRWKDGSEDYFPMEALRAASPSAENVGERDLLGNIHGGNASTQFDGVKVTGWSVVGGYAFQFHFSDGHQTGLYSYDYLKRLSQVLAEADDGPGE